MAEEKKEVNKEKQKALQLTMDKLEKTYGKAQLCAWEIKQLKMLKQFHPAQ